MGQIFQQYGLLIIMAVVLVAMMMFSSRSRKKMQEQQERQKREIAESLVPGVWVKTALGFWGRFVDQDGDIVILETPDGTETYWERQAIRGVGEPPFATDETAEIVADADDDSSETVLGLDSSAPDTPSSPIDSDGDDRKN